MPRVILLTCAWALGIALAQQFVPPSEILLLLGLPILGGLLLYRRDPVRRYAALCALFGLLGAVRLGLAAPTIDAAHIAFYNDGEPVTLVAQVADEPDVRDNYTNLRLAAESITLANGEKRAVHGLVLVRAPRYPAYHYGETLAIEASLETPPIYESFSYRDYLARQGVYSMVRRPRIKRLAEQSGFSLKAGIFRFKAQAHQVINRILPEPNAALLNGILLGIESGIPRSLYDQFNATGASHVIVISGSNISLVVAILLLLGQRLVGKRAATGLAVIGVVLYTVMVGADASVTRAAIMGLLYVGAIYFGRGNNVLNALFLTGFGMTLYNPLTLWDIGFQLSFLATLGLIILVPHLEHAAERLFAPLFASANLQALADLIREALLVSLAAQIIVTPILIYHFGRLSIVSLLTNLLIVPVQPLVMLFGGLATVAGLIYLPLGQIVGWLAWLPLAWTINVVQWTARFSWAQVEILAPPFWLVGLMYLTMAAALWWLDQPAKTRRQVAQASGLSRSTSVALGGSIILVILIWSATRNLPDGKLHVAFLEIGQGDAVLITTPNGRQILIDGGPSPAHLGQRLGDEMPFWDRSLDMVINTHPDMDHLGGLVELVDRYEIETVLVSDAEGRSSLYRAWVNQLEAADLLTTVAQQGMTLQLDEGVQAQVLNPGPASQFTESPNDHSVVIKVSLGEISFLLTGDIEEEVERTLARSSLDLQATILKSPHHGSKTSSSSAFLDAVNPQIAVISAGVENRFGHPHEVVLQRYAERGINTLRTDQLGTVELITDGKQVWVETGW